MYYLFLLSTHHHPLQMVALSLFRLPNGPLSLPHKYCALYSVPYCSTGTSSTTICNAALNVYFISFYDFHWTHSTVSFGRDGQ